jgi:hypothetical protein
MASTQTMTSCSMFTSPFHDPSNDPKAFGSYTSCQGPPANLNTSPVAKIRKHIASTFTPKCSKANSEFLKSKPFDSDILILDFIPEANPPKPAKPAKPAPERAISAPPAARKTYKPPVTSNVLDPFAPFDENIVSISFITDDLPKQPKPNRKLRHFSSRATIADTSPSTSTSHLLEDEMSTRTLSPINGRPTTAGGDDGPPPTVAGRLGKKACRCSCGCLECHRATTKLCRCVCTCKDCHCRTRNLPQRILRMWQHRGSPTWQHG